MEGEKATVAGFPGSGRRGQERTCAAAVYHSVFIFVAIIQKVVPNLLVDGQPAHHLLDFQLRDLSVVVLVPKMCACVGWGGIIVEEQGQQLIVSFALLFWLICSVIHCSRLAGKGEESLKARLSPMRARRTRFLLEVITTSISLNACSIFSLESCFSLFRQADMNSGREHKIN